jgi:copper chaperone CopZ
MFSRKGWKQRMEEVVVSIPKINCSGCAGKVRRVLQGLPGLEVIQVDHVSKTAHFRYTVAETSRETIRAALAEARYPMVEEHDTATPTTGDK